MKAVQRLSMVLLGIAAWLGAFPPAQAQSKGAPETYPARPIRLIVAFAPGGGNDTLSRAVAQRLGESLGQQIVVDNRGGAGGVLGSGIVAKAAPDGYTLLMGSSSLAVNPSLIPKMPFDPVKDLTPVVPVGAANYVLVVHPSVPVKSVQDLVALARAKPGQLNYASAGNGSPLHMGAELFKSMTGTQLIHIPYKGGFPAVQAVVSGEAQLAFGSNTAVLPLVKAGRLRALGVTSAKRSALYPDLPTVAESGVPGYESSNWYGLMAPARTPRAIVAKLNAEVTKVMQIPELRERMMANQGIEPLGGTPEQFAEFFRNEVAKWAKVTRDAKIRIE